MIARGHGLALMLTLTAGCAAAGTPNLPMSDVDLTTAATSDDGPAQNPIPDLTSAVPIADLRTPPPPPDLTPPPPAITVACGANTCHGVTSSCCYPFAGAMVCIVPGSSCVGGEFRCDGAHDCASTEECCQETEGSKCVSIGTCGQRLCRSAADCKLGEKCCSPTGTHQFAYCSGTTC